MLVRVKKREEGGDSNEKQKRKKIEGNLRERLKRRERENAEHERNLGYTKSPTKCEGREEADFCEGI